MGGTFLQIPPPIKKMTTYSGTAVAYKGGTHSTNQALECGPVLPRGSKHSKKDKVYNQDPTVMILNFRTDMSGQTVQTQIRLLLEEQSDQGLHCSLFHFASY